VEAVAISRLDIRKSETAPGRKRTRVYWGAYLYILPALALYAVFVAYPLVYTAVLSFYEWNGLAPAWQAVGIENYRGLLQDRVVGVSLRNAGILTVGQVAGMVIALALAVFLNGPYRGKGIVRTIIFMPRVLAVTIIGITWATFLDASIGPVNNALRALGLGSLARPWLGDPSLAIWALTLVLFWSTLGFPMVVYLGALQSMDPEINEAAQIDGANRWQIFWRVTFPLLSGTHLTLLMLGVIGAVQEFGLPWLMTSGGPFYSTYTLALHTYVSVFQWNRLGYGSAISQLLLVLLLALTVLQRVLLRRGGE
jgi:ABC-type sugar transport system permease subunit